MWSFSFFLNSILLGIGLTMDAFSVSIADGLNEPNMKKHKMLGIALTFAIFQFAMPMIGWLCVHTLLDKFTIFRYAIPWIALILLGFIGGKMIYENLRHKEEEGAIKKLGIVGVLVQGVATSIDALSVGFTVSNYGWIEALISCLIIAFITLAFCIIGLFFGRKLGEKFTSKAELIGGIILIGIGLEIFITNLIELYV